MKSSRHLTSGHGARRAAATLVTLGVLGVAGFAGAAPAAAAPTPTSFVLTSNDRGSGTLPSATVAAPYAVQLEDGSPPGTDTYLLYGSLPPGITMSSAGLIHGTPVLPQTARVLVEAYNAATKTQVRLEFLDLMVSSGNSALDATLIPIGTTVANATNSTVTELQGVLSLPGDIANCVLNPAAPPTCLPGLGL